MAKRGKKITIVKARRRLAVSARRTPKVRPIIHRPRVIERGGAFFRPEHTRLFAGGPVMINPRRRRRVRRSFLRRFHNPVSIRFPRKLRRRARHNPFNVKSTLKMLTNRKWLTNVATISGGLALGFAGKTVLTNLLPMAKMEKYRNFVGIGHVVLGALMIGLMKQRVAKEAGVVVAAVGLYDLLAQNVTALKLPEIPAVPLVANIGTTTTMKGSYDVPVLPVSPVAAMAGSYQRPAASGYAGSYAAPGMQTQGFHGMSNPYEGIDW